MSDKFKEYIKNSGKVKIKQSISKKVVKESNEEIRVGSDESTLIGELTIEEFKSLFESLVSEKKFSVKKKMNKESESCDDEEDDDEEDEEIEEAIDSAKVKQAAMKVAKDVFGDKIDKEKVDQMVKKAISMGKDTEDAIGIFQSFFKESVKKNKKPLEESFLVSHANSLLDGMPDQEETIVEYEEVHIDTTDVSQLSPTDHAEALL